MTRLLTKPWYEVFVECTDKHCETPSDFLLWSAFSVISGVMKNHVRLKYSIYDIKPNMHIILTAPPGIGKGTAIKFAYKMVKDAKPWVLVNTLSDRLTAPKIIQEIADGWTGPPQFSTNGAALLGGKDHTVTIVSEELRTLVSASDWMLEFLCQAWDQDEYEYKTKNMGSSHVKGMCVSLIGATVPDFLRSMNDNGNALSYGGYASRCLFIYVDKLQKQIPFPPPIEDDPYSMGLKQKLIEDLKHISSLRGDFKISTDARILFENKYIMFQPTFADSESMANFKNRMKVHVLKLAMILAVSERDDLVIHKIHMDRAIQLVQMVFNRLDKIFRGVGNSQYADPIARLQYIFDLGGLYSRKELLTHTYRHIHPDALDRILMVMKEMGFIEEVQVGKSVQYSAKKKKGTP